MLKGTFPIDKFKAITTPFYYYDIELLKETLHIVRNEADKYGYHVHYAVKANANPRILSIIAESGLGADCVSGGEVQAALDAGFPSNKIVYAGVGKADWEINLGLDNDIFYCSELVYDIYKNQLDIELCEPKKGGDYLILGTDKLDKIENTMQRRGITKEQYAVAPVDVFESEYLHSVK